MEQNLTLYHIFNAVAEAGNISRAAKELYISQPAISKSISKLEQSLDTKLFNRSSRGVTLTDSGKLLYEHTSAAFHQLEKGEDRLRHSRQLGIGRLRIGASTTLCKYVLLPCLKEFTERYPHIRISIQCQSTFQTMALLQNHKVDIGLIGRPSSGDSLTFEPVGEIHDIFAATPAYLKNLLEREPDVRMPETHEAHNHGAASPQNGTSPLSLRSAEYLFPYANLMLLDEDNISRRYIDSWFHSHNVGTGTIHTVSSMDLLIEFARIGLGIACIIGEFVQDDLASGELISLPLRVQPEKRQIGFSYLKDVPLSEPAQKFMDFCKA